jgi:hypothetical protein
VVTKNGGDKKLLTIAIESHFNHHRVYGNQNGLMLVIFIFTMGNMIWVLVLANPILM